MCGITEEGDLLEFWRGEVPAAAAGPAPAAVPGPPTPPPTNNRHEIMN